MIIEKGKMMKNTRSGNVGEITNARGLIRVKVRRRITKDGKDHFVHRLWMIENLKPA